jgi:hypothetical protein
MKIATLSALLQHLGLADKPPHGLECRTTAEVITWLRAAWNFGHAAGAKEAIDVYREEKLKEIEEAAQEEAKANAPDAGLYLGAWPASQTCVRECKRRLRH